MFPAFIRTWIREQQYTWALNVPPTEPYCLVLRGNHCFSILFKESAAAGGVCFRSLLFPVQHDPLSALCVYDSEVYFTLQNNFFLPIVASYFLKTETNFLLFSVIISFQNNSIFFFIFDYIKEFAFVKRFYGIESGAHT